MTEDEFTFIWVNESKTGFSHLYKITSLLHPGCHCWAEAYHHTEGNQRRRFPALSQDVAPVNFMVWLYRRLQMCSQGGGHIDKWRVGSPGKTRFQGWLFRYGILC